MKLLHVIPYYAPAWTYGGSVRAATDLTQALAADGHSVFVLTTDTLSPTRRLAARREAIGGVHVFRVRNASNHLRGRLNLSTPIGMADAARRLIRDHAIDVVHCHELRTVENLRVAPVARRLGVPVVLSPHGTLPYDTGRSLFKRGWDGLVGGRVLLSISHVIALTAAEAEDARKLWDTQNPPLSRPWINIVPNGVHLRDFEHLPAGDPFRARWRLGSGPVVLFMGRLHERKGLHLLLPAFADVVKRLPDARLLVAGPDEGMLGTLTAQVSQYNLGGRVVFTGMLSGQDRLAAFAAANLFALPAVGEGFSMAVLEAMACGLPALLTPGCNFPEAGEAGAGLIVARDPGPLSVGLHALLSDSERRAAMGRAARDLVRTRYTWEHIVGQMVEAYHTAKDRRRG